MRLTTIILTALAVVTLPSTALADDQADGYWYCPSGIYPRYNGEPAPEEGCTETEPVIVSEDGLTATGVWTVRPRPLPATSLPSTGFDPVLFAVAGVLIVGGVGLRRVGRPRIG